MSVGRTRALERFFKPAAPVPTTLQTEAIGDGRVNCLEAAFANSRTKGGTLVVLSDTRDDTGHVLNQQADGRIFDPATPDTTYPDMRAWEAASNSDQHYQVQGVVTAREAEAIMALPPGSSERSALLAQTPLVDLKTGRATGQMATALSRISVADAASDTDVAAVLHANAAAAAAIDALPVGSGTEAIIGTAIEAAYQDLHNQNPNWTSAELMHPGDGRHRRRRGVWPSPRRLIAARPCSTWVATKTMKPTTASPRPERKSAPTRGSRTP